MQTNNRSIAWEQFAFIELQIKKYRIEHIEKYNSCLCEIKKTYHKKYTRQELLRGRSNTLFKDLTSTQVNLLPKTDKKSTLAWNG